MTGAGFRSTFLLLLVGGVTAAFVVMIRPFLLTILLAAVFTGVGYPTYRRVLRAFGGRSTLATIATLLLLVTLVIGPFFGVLVAAGNEALRISQTVGSSVQRLMDSPGEAEGRLRALPGARFVVPYRQQILMKVGDIVGGTGAFLFEAISATTRAGILFVFHFFVLIYTMYFFMSGGPRLLQSAVAYLPLTEDEKQRMFDRFISVTRATLKGTVLIGIAQGVLGGISFWAVGIEGAIFWGVVMTVLSVIPGVGGSLVWVPAAIILAAQGELGRAIGLTVFSVLVVGSVDNVLRPLVVGRDTQMHELMIFFSTLGGLLLFGASGFIVGPILAALFLTVWEMFGMAIRSPGAPSGKA